MVELAADGVGCLLVGGVAVSGEGDGALEVDLGGLVVGSDGGEPAFCGGDFCCDAGLLGAEEVEGDRVGVVRVEELLSFAFELVEAATLGLLLAMGVCFQVFEFAFEE